MDELNELEGLTTIEKNSRRGGQNFDIFHDAENNQFTVSDAFYTAHHMNDNGFKTHVGNGNVYLSIQPNEESVSYKGREGYDKGKAFTSTTTSELMKKADLTGDLDLVEIGEKQGATYFRVENVVEEEPEVITDELAVENEESLTTEL